MSVSIQCNECKEILVSRYRHDFVVCKCFRDSKGTRGCYLDGGGDPYYRVGGDPNTYTWIERCSDDY